MLRFAVCDDQQEILDEMQKLIILFSKQRSVMVEICRFSNGKELLDSEVKYDLIFLDIEMGIFNGIETAQKIREIDMNVPIVYITNYTDYWRKAYKVHAFEFITKPFSSEDIFNVLSDFIATICEKESKKIELVSDKGLVILEEDDICYFLCTDIKRKIIVHTVDEEIIVKGNLNVIFSKLTDGKFYIPHRSCIVNLKYVKTIDNYYEIIMRNGEYIPLAQKKRNEFKVVLHKYLSNKK